MTTILVGSTVPAFAMSGLDYGWWISNARQITAEAANDGHYVDWVVVCQEDARGRDIFTPLVKDMEALGGHVIWFSLDLNMGPRWTTGTRLAGICTARNLIIDYALRELHEWIYFADSDIEAPDDVLINLLEVGWPVVGAHVPTYGLDGPRVAWDATHGNFAEVLGPTDMDLRRHWNTAGSLLVRREVFRKVPWRHDPDAGCTDDPATQNAMADLGYPTLVRHDVICRHHPERIGAFELRGLDLEVYR